MRSYNRAVVAAGILMLIIAAASCRQPKPVATAKITQFRVTPEFIPRGLPGKLCYGVENAAKVALNPPMDGLLPAVEHCVDISPVKTTTYTLTVTASDGAQVTKSVEVRVGNPPPRISDLSATPVEVKRGGQVKVCFKVENAKTLKVSRGKLDRRSNCVTDRPRKTATYKITALGADREEDTGTVTVKVR